MKKFYKLISKNPNFLACIKFIFMLVLVATIGTTNAQNYTPNTFTDPVITTLNNTTGAINGGATISLRSALMAADNLGGTHIVTLSTGTYNLSKASSSQITIGNTSQNITINGNGPANTIINMVNDANRDRILFINPAGTTNSPVITVSGIRFQNGYLSSDTYGGAAICAGGGSAESLTITNCIFDNNVLPANAYGGAAVCMQVRGNLSINTSTFTNNVSNDADGGAVLFIISNTETLGTGFGTLNVTNSTFTNNSVVFPGAGTSNGGALAFTGQGGCTPFNVTINSNTFTDNTADGLGGAISANNSPNVSIPQINFNRIVNNTSAASAASSGLHFVESSGSVNAENNWWGCNTGPTASPCDRAGGDVAGGGSLAISKWLQLKTTASPTTICNTAASVPTNTSTITTSFLSNSANEAISTANLSTLIGRTINWGPTTLGSLSGQQGTIQASGTATALFTSNGTGGTSTVNAQVDNVSSIETTPSRASITVNTASVAPTGTTGATTVCSGAATTLTVSGGIKGTSAVTEWFTGLCGGTLVFTGDAYTTPVLFNNTTYYVRYKGTCNTTTCATINVFVNDVTGGTVGSDQTICSGSDPALFTQTLASTGSGALTYQWQSSTTSCAAGFSNIAGATATTYDPPAGLAVTTYYRRVTTSTLNAVPCIANSNCITVSITPNNTVILTSAAGTNAQTVCINMPITNITYATTGATDATFSGLPAGVTGNWASNVVTIAGTPTASGPFNYTVTLTGGCGIVTATGTITVHPVILNLVSPTNDYSTGTITQKATQTINATNKIISPANITYQAGKGIFLNPGFASNTGTVFKAQIAACN